MEEFNRTLYAYNKGYRVDLYGNAFGLTGKKLKLDLSKSGYYSFNCRLPNGPSRIFVHQLQAYTKFGDAYLESNIQARHLNGIPLDNSWDNIAIGTQSDNMMDILKEVRVKSAIIASNAANPRIKENRFKIYEALKNGISYKKIRKEFNVPLGTLSYMKNDSKEYKEYIKETCG